MPAYVLGRGRPNRKYPPLSNRAPSGTFINLPETGTAVEALAVTVQLSLVDTAVGADALTAGVPIAVADSGSGVDTLTALVKTIFLADSGGGDEGIVVTGPTVIAVAGVVLDSSDSGLAVLDSAGVTTGNSLVVLDSAGVGVVTLDSAGLGEATVQT